MGENNFGGEVSEGMVEQPKTPKELAVACLSAIVDRASGGSPKKISITDENRAVVFAALRDLIQTNLESVITIVSRENSPIVHDREQASPSSVETVEIRENEQLKQQLCNLAEECALETKSVAAPERSGVFDRKMREILNALGLEFKKMNGLFFCVDPKNPTFSYVFTDPYARGMVAKFITIGDIMYPCTVRAGVVVLGNKGLSHLDAIGVLNPFRDSGCKAPEIKNLF